MSKHAGGPQTEAAQILIDLGYTPVKNPGSIISPLYVREGETLYLYRPILDEDAAYVFVPHPVDRPFWQVDASTATIFYPPGEDGKPANTKGLWMARDYETRPQMFGVREAAEHLGLSESAIRSAMYRSQTLLPTQQVGGRGTVLFSDESLHAWSGRRKPGSPRSPRYRSPELLRIMSRDRLVELAGSLLSSGEMSVGSLAEKLNVRGYNVSSDNAQAVLDAVSRAERGDLVEVLAK